jgi:hypothetical protein
VGHVLFGLFCAVLVPVKVFDWPTLEGAVCVFAGGHTMS